MEEKNARVALERKVENSQYEQRSVENDLRKTIGEQQREIERLKIINEENEEKLKTLTEKLHIHVETVKYQMAETIKQMDECTLADDSGHFNTHDDVPIFLKAIEEGTKNVKFRVCYISPFNQPPGWNLSDYYHTGTTRSHGNPYFRPKSIHQDDSKTICGEYGLSTIIESRPGKYLLFFALFVPPHLTLRIDADFEGAYRTKKYPRNNSNLKGKKLRSL